MKGFTKTIAAFCAMAMIFGMFSATVFADETDIPQVAAGEAAGDEPQAAGSLPQSQSQYTVPVSGNASDEAGASADAGSVAGSVPGNDGDDNPATDAQPEEVPTVNDQPVNDQPVNDQPDVVQQEDGQENDVNDADKKSNDKDSVDKDSAEKEPADKDSLKNEVDKEDDKNVKPSKGLTRSGIVEIDQNYININDGKLPVESGTYKLVEPISVSETTIFNVDGAVITLDLNGYNLTYTGTTGLFIVGATNGTSVSAAVKLTITDSSSTPGTITATNTTKGNTDVWISCNNNATALTTGTNANRGGCILIRNSSEVVLEKVTISNFHAEDEGGAIQASNGSFFTMKSGKITNCSAKVAGGAIAGHAASNGTTVNGMNLVSTVRIEGGELSGNSARAGSAVRILRCNFYMTGGVITNNTATGGSGEAGGAIFISKIKRNPCIEMSGNPQIYGNNCSEDSKKADLFFYDKTTIHVVGNLDASAKLVFAGAEINNNFFDISNATYSMNSFISNHDGYIAYVSGDYIKLKQGVLPKIEGYQLLIGGEIKLRAFVSLAEYANSQTSVGYAYSYTKGSKTVNVSKTIASSELTASGSNYSFDIPVESACITSPITVTITYTDGQVTGDPVTIEQYIKAVLDGDYPTKVKDIAYSLWYYGGVAMLQFNINRNDPSLKPANWEIDGNLYDPAQAPKYEIGEGAAYTPANDPDGAFYGASVNFLSKTEVNLYFKKSVLGDTAPSMTVTYAGNETETVSATVNGSYYVYTVKGPTGDGFAATLFDVPFSFSVGNVSGEYSVDTYLQVIEYKYHGQSNNVLLLLVEKYYDFAKKCQQL